jgi:decaprenylphospho-beta-D-erythro-pentofuranosid-2-ulose 2-reductase
MTAGLPEAPMTIDPQDVARITVAAMRQGRSLVYAPAQLRYVMGLLKTLPRPVFRKLAERQG